MATIAPAKVGETRVLWATDFENIEEGPYETVAVFVEKEYDGIVKEYHGQPECYWQLSNGIKVMTGEHGTPLYDCELAETEEEGYNNCITVLRDRIAAMQDAVAYLESQQRDVDATEDTDEEE